MMGLVVAFLATFHNSNTPKVKVLDGRYPPSPMTFKKNVRKGSAMYLLSEEGFEIFSII